MSLSILFVFFILCLVPIILIIIYLHENWLLRCASAKQLDVTSSVRDVTQYIERPIKFRRLAAVAMPADNNVTMLNVIRCDLRSLRSGLKEIRMSVKLVVLVITFILFCSEVRAKLKEGDCEGKKVLAKIINVARSIPNPHPFNSMHQFSHQV